MGRIAPRTSVVLSVVLATLLFAALYYSTAAVTMSARFPVMRLVGALASWTLVPVGSFLVARQVSKRLRFDARFVMLGAWYVGSRLGALLGLLTVLGFDAVWFAAPSAVSLGLLPAAGQSWSLLSTARALGVNLLLVLLVVAGARRGQASREHHRTSGSS